MKIDIGKKIQNAIMPMRPYEFNKATLKIMTKTKPRIGFFSLYNEITSNIPKQRNIE